MTTELFALDPMAASSYGLYSALKKEEGSFLDFLLHYDSKGANEGNNEWLTDLISEDIFSKITDTDTLQALSFYGFDTFSLFSQKSYFDTQVEAYKNQLEQEMIKRVNL
jgi:hypothetical protein